MKNLLRAITKMPVKPYLVFSSSMAVYADLPQAIRETNLKKPFDIYGKSKLASEKLIRAAARRIGFHYTIFRFANVYGPKSTVPHIIPRIVTQLKKSTLLRLGNTSPRRDFVHVTDVVTALVAALTHQKPHAIYNLGTGVATSIRKLVLTARDVTGLDIVISTVTANTVRHKDRANLQANIAAIKRDLGWQPQVSLADGLREIMTIEGITNRRKLLWNSLTNLILIKR